MVRSHHSKDKSTTSTAKTFRLIDYALGYACRGWSIIPVRGKVAIGSWKTYQSKPPDENSLRRLFEDETITGLAVILGKASCGLGCRDFDVVDEYHQWACENPLEAESVPTVRTRRGYHVYGRVSQEMYQDFGTGELRADSGHYVLLPPSLHPDGGRYEWVVSLPEEEVPELSITLFSTKGVLVDSVTQIPRYPATQHVSQIVFGNALRKPFPQVWGNGIASFFSSFVDSKLLHQKPRWKNSNHTFLSGIGWPCRTSEPKNGK